MEVKRNTFLHQNPKLAEEKAFFSRANRSLEPREKGKASKCYQQKVAARNIDGKPLFPPKSSGHDQKPWPTKASAQAEELVKNMSNVPGYLQRVEKGDNLQEKALNFGVLDWQSLERWTGDRRHVIGNEKAAVSPASSNASSSFSMFGSSSRSYRSSGSSYVAHSTQSSSLNRCQVSSTEEGHKEISVAEASSNTRGCYSPEIAHRRCPIRHRISCSGEKGPSVVNLVAMFEESKQTDMAKFEERKQKDPEFYFLSDDVKPSPGANSWHPRSNDCATSNSANGKMKRLEVVPDHREKRSGELGFGCSDASVCKDDDCPEDNHSGSLEVNNGMSGHFQKNFHCIGRVSFESTESGLGIQTESGCRSSGTFHSEDFQFATFSPHVAHSCPFPYDSRSECSDANICEGSEVSSDSTNSSPHPAVVARVRLNGCQEKHEKSAKRPHNNPATKTSEKWDWTGVKPVSPRAREPLPGNHLREGTSGMIRSSSLRESSPMRQPKLTSLDKHNGDKAADCRRGRRSPLRRLLDPLLKKPNAPSRACPTRSSTNQPSCQKELISTPGLRSSDSPSMNSSHNGACDKGPNSASRLPPENRRPVNDGKHETSTKQALVRLAWKNGLPLLTFSVNESDILAVTRRKGTSVKQDHDYIYTFYYVHEIKKKTGGWIGQGNKGKRKELVSRVVGQMNVSCPRRTSSHFTLREFALFGPELRPTAHEALEPVPCSELAAIVVRIAEESVVRSICDIMPQGSSCRDQLDAKLMKDKCACPPVGRPGSVQSLQDNDPAIVAILPGEVHGLSDGSKPSPLVERWKSGGLCDCGGWDVGCSLSILTNKLQDSGHGAGQSCHTTDGTHRVELFMQGADQESRPIFSVVAFKEELYTVHFHASVAPLQAFAVCIALLHTREHTGLDELHDSRRRTPAAEASPAEDPAMVKQVGLSSMSAAPCHPPLSPVGRA